MLVSDVVTIILHIAGRSLGYWSIKVGRWNSDEVDRKDFFFFKRDTVGEKQIYKHKGNVFTNI